MKDLVVLTADGTMRISLLEILNRYQSLGTRQFTFDVYDHPEHDPAVLRRAHTFLQTLRDQYAHALLIFDREGCGSPKPAAELVAEVQANMDRAGWAGQSSVTVLDPELEIWLWAESPHVARALGWNNSLALKKWLEDNGYLATGERKPTNPKGAMEAALLKAKLPISTSIYGRIARTVSLARCEDQAFIAFQANLRSWFPA